MAGSDVEYLRSCGLAAVVDSMVTQLLEEKPADPIRYCREYLESAEGSSSHGGSKMMKAGAPAGRATRTVDWKAISAKLPAGKTPEEKNTRDRLFRDFDPNGNGYLSLAEVDKGLRDILRIDSIFNCKPAIMRAFQAAKKANPESRARLGGDYVTRSEFRLLLVYLRRYFELFVMFEGMDANSDRRLTSEEFAAAAQKVEAWGIKTFYPELHFKNIDKNGGGMILFDEFAEWALAQHLELEDDEDQSSAAAGGRAQKATVRGGRPTIDWKALALKLPSGKTSVEKAKRDELFKLFDPNGNGYLSLAEVDKGVRDILQIDSLFNCKPALMRAFQASKNFSTNGRAPLGADYVTRSEFRILLLYLKRYFELFQMFDLVDSGADRRVDFYEFERAVTQLQGWGIQISNARGEFNSIDRNHGGQLLFDEFAAWALQKQLQLEDARVQ
eukprot:TRINITY_DN2168_c0_g1_i1.p1 TRINITY_DN2168_c0_g1~~TRINITY_DN2168_c0_g1_i1.p1  ORF type:complete len:443 (-),score=92.95 TRINITY_DN2168_c0_g1_i1:126-1454(-)